LVVGVAVVDAEFVADDFVILIEYSIHFFVAVAVVAVVVY
jgi:hypothetical protein